MKAVLFLRFLAFNFGCRTDMADRRHFPLRRSGARVVPIANDG